MRSEKIVHEKKKAFYGYYFFCFRWLDAQANLATLNNKKTI
ncbi:hypothetical protein BAZMOX_04471_4 [methanotrophic endosymbiont of Bathymodiolus azoricus (Menez Gwen)]|jgi:hypothetical protein|nr:hypothetical protein BAZMOX_04471_4 [methanotrophic endosymbiont of Bathymodiolus azoricus (Menez Gwen)]